MDIEALRELVKAESLPDGWLAQGACRGLDTSIFFTPKPDPIAREACSSCSVTLVCLAFGLRTRDDEAFMGNTTAAERREIAALLGRKRQPNGYTKKAELEPGADPLAGTEIKHGTYAGYTHGCHETCCRVAKNAYVAEQRASKRERDLAISA